MIFRQEIPIVSSMLVNLLAEYEHLCDITANLCSVLYSRCNQNTNLMKELIIDLSKQDFSETAKSTVLIKNSSHFLVLILLVFDDHLDMCIRTMPFLIITLFTIIIKTIR